MRATWIVTHLTAGSPVKALVEAAGVDSLEALTRYLRFVPDADVADVPGGVPCRGRGCETP